MDRRNAGDIQIDVEIVQFLQECGFAFTENDIQRPTAPVMQKIYEFVLQTFTGTSPAVWESPSGEILNALEYSELYAESLSLMIFCKHL